MEADTGGTDAGFQSALFEHVFEKNGESMNSSTANQLKIAPIPLARRLLTTTIYYFCPKPVSRPGVQLPSGPYCGMAATICRRSPLVLLGEWRKLSEESPFSRSELRPAGSTLGVRSYICLSRPWR